MILELIGLLPLAKEQLNKVTYSIQFDKEMDELKEMWEKNKWDCIEHQLRNNELYVYWQEGDAHLVQMRWNEYKYNRECAESGLPMDEFVVKYAYREYFDKNNYTSKSLVFFDTKGDKINYILSKRKTYDFDRKKRCIKIEIIKDGECIYKKEEEN